MVLDHQFCAGRTIPASWETVAPVARRGRSLFLFALRQNYTCYTSPAGGSSRKRFEGENGRTCSGNGHAPRNPRRRLPRTHVIAARLDTREDTMMELDVTKPLLPISRSREPTGRSRDLARASRVVTSDRL